jgi:hypothetical protein
MSSCKTPLVKTPRMEHKLYTLTLPEAEIKRGHGGIPTEWELTFSNEDVKKRIRALPDLWPVQHSTEDHKDYHGNWIHLPEGVPQEFAAMLFLMVMAEQYDHDHLVATLKQVQAKFGRQARFRRKA